MKASVATTAGLSAQRSLLKAVEELVLNMRDVVSPLSAKRFFEAQQPTERLGEAEEE